MKTVRLACFILITVLLPFFVFGCTEKYDYPDWFTGEYCRENYTVMSGNYVHSRAYENSVDNKGEVIRFDEYGGTWQFYAIYGESIEDYILGYRFYLFNSRENRILKSKSTDTDPIRDYDIQSIEICAVFSEAESKEDALNYEEACTVMKLDQNTESDLADAIKQCYLEHVADVHNDDASFDLVAWSKKAMINYTASEDDSSYITDVILRVRFEETENIMWQSCIVEYDGNLYLECGECMDNHKGYWLISLNETVTDYINSVLSSNPEIYFK